MLLILALSGCAAAPRPASTEPTAAVASSTWTDSFEQVSPELGRWAQAYPQTAARLSHWDGCQPEQSEAFLNWAVGYPAQSLEVFSAQHPDWVIFEDMLGRDRAAMKTLLSWTHRHPQLVPNLLTSHHHVASGSGSACDTTASAR
jgi:hypothetical protein